MCVNRCALCVCGCQVQRPSPSVWHSGRASAAPHATTAPYCGPALSPRTALVADVRMSMKQAKHVSNANSHPEKNPNSDRNPHTFGSHRLTLIIRALTGTTKRGRTAEPTVAHSAAPRCSVRRTRGHAESGGWATDSTCGPNTALPPLFFWGKRICIDQSGKRQETTKFTSNTHSNVPFMFLSTMSFEHLGRHDTGSYFNKTANSSNLTSQESEITPNLQLKMSLWITVHAHKSHQQWHKLNSELVEDTLDEFIPISPSTSPGGPVGHDPRAGLARLAGPRTSLARGGFTV